MSCTRAAPARVSSIKQVLDRALSRQRLHDLESLLSHAEPFDSWPFLLCSVGHHPRAQSIIIIIMASPASKAGGSGFGGKGGDVELGGGGGGEQFVTAHIVHHRDGSQTVNKQIINPFTGGVDNSIVIHETEQHPPVPSYYVNAQVVPGAAAAPQPEPSISCNAVISLVLGCVAFGFLLIGSLAWPLIFRINLGAIPALAMIFGTVALCQIRKSLRRQRAGEEQVRQWRGQWQAMTGIVLGSVALFLQIPFIVYMFLFGGWQ
jgi:hypothetical protein